MRTETWRSRRPPHRYHVRLWHHGSLVGVGSGETAEQAEEAARSAFRAGQAAVLAAQAQRWMVWARSAADPVDGLNRCVRTEDHREEADASSL